MADVDVADDAELLELLEAAVDRGEVDLGPAAPSPPAR